MLGEQPIDGSGELGPHDPGHVLAAGDHAADGAGPLLERRHRAPEHLLMLDVFLREPEQRAQPRLFTVDVSLASWSVCGTMNSLTKAKMWQEALPMTWFSLRFSSSSRQAISSTPASWFGRKRFE